MPINDTNLAERSGGLVESHKGYDPRIVFFYFVLAALLLILVGGLSYQQLFKSQIHDSRERMQNQRRVLVPGPRGNIYDRDHNLLVGNRPQFSVVLYIDELKTELYREHVRIHNNYLATSDKLEVPSYSELEQITRVSLAQRYLDVVNAILHRTERVDSANLQRHFQRELLLPYTLLDDLSPEDYARLLERLPVNSPLQVYSSSTRFYPYGSTAAHVLGYVRPDDDVDSEELGGDDLRTFKMKGTSGKGGLELQFDSTLQGEAGGSIFRVDPAGYKVNSPDLPHRLPVQGKNVVTSLDLDLQLAAEEALAPHDHPEDAVTGAAVALDVATGEVLVLASKPDYDLSKFSPRASQAVVDEMNTSGSWNNLAVDGIYPPGSTFKLVVSMAGLRRGTLLPEDDSIDCEGTIRIGNSRKGCDNGLGHHGKLTLPDAIAASCDIYYYEHGIAIGPDAIAEEARRFHLDQPTHIELPGESRRMLIPTKAWKLKTRNEGWTDGDTANMSIGQGDVQVTPLQMACFAASLARGETTTRPTLLHDPQHPRQHTESIGLTAEQRAILLEGMAKVVTDPRGTGFKFFNIPGNSIPGVHIAGKTGTAQYGNKLNVAWFLCFAPLEKPEIAVVAAVRSSAPNEGYAGGWDGAKIVLPILKKYFEKKAAAGSALFAPIKQK